MELSSDPIQTGTKREPSKTKEESGGPASAGGSRRTRMGELGRFWETVSSAVQYNKGYKPANM